MPIRQKYDYTRVYVGSQPPFSPSMDNKMTTKLKVELVCIANDYYLLFTEEFHDTVAKLGEDAVFRAFPSKVLKILNENAERYSPTLRQILYLVYANCVFGNSLSVSEKYTK